VQIHGNTDIGILRAYLETVPIPEQEWQPMIPEVIEFMGAHVERNAADLRPELCPSVLALIQWLNTRSKLLGVASGNVERVGWAKLRACGLRDYFSLGAFSGVLEKREDVIAHGIRQARNLRGEKTIVCVVGDTPSDIRSAHANDIPAIAVATGIYTVEELLAHHPEVCISCCEDLLRN
jgi:phosphoglycolate phosphatase-like HAD superfamily hydrolase